MSLMYSHGKPHPDDVTKVVGFDDSVMNRIVVSAANLVDDGSMLLGVRHHDKLMRNQMIKLKLHPNQIVSQGFVDQFGNFLTREEAYQCVVKNKQAINGKMSLSESNKLFSEHLY